MKKIAFYALFLSGMLVIVSPQRAYSQAGMIGKTSTLLAIMDQDPVATNKVGKDTEGATQAADRKENKLKSLIEEEAKQQGLITGIMSSAVFLYSSISDLLLHPVLTIIISVLTIGLLVLGIFILVLLRREDFSAFGKLSSFSILYLLLYVDLLLILYEKRKITLMFFQFDKDILFVALAAAVGYFIGRHSSEQVFEEKVLP